MKRTQIDIYGRKYSVTSEYEERYIDRLTQYVNSKIKELVIKNPRLDYADACALCLLNVADDIASTQDKLNSVNAKLEEIQGTRDNSDLEIKKLEDQIKKLEGKNEELDNLVRKRDNEIIKLKMQLEKDYQNKAEKNIDKK